MMMMMMMDDDDDEDDEGTGRGTLETCFCAAHLDIFQKRKRDEANPAPTAPRKAPQWVKMKTLNHRQSREGWTLPNHCHPNHLPCRALMEEINLHMPLG